MTVRIVPVLWVCIVVGAGGCNPKQDPTFPTVSQR